ncbi:MAG: PfkB family carbohydrate kinase [Synechococcaceae cyanobacterium]|nr:PfkB family carbohydrate kinase [Synechococcaceae cyanobacterium]
MPRLALAVVGHVEVVTFLSVDRLPESGAIVHAVPLLETAAGGGAVVAVQMARLSGRRVPFFTALGRDRLGAQAVTELEALGLDLHVAWRDAPTRRGISMVDASGERTITVIGERLTPHGDDPLPWSELACCDGVFVTAADASALQQARRAPLLAATPRVRCSELQRAGVRLDALIGSGLDPAERYEPGDLDPEPRLQVATEGALGGRLSPGGRFSALPRHEPVRDAYGAGDSFAAGVTAGLAAQWSVAEAIDLGCHCGMAALDAPGPYASQLNRQRAGWTDERSAL